MHPRSSKIWFLSVFLLALLPVLAWAQAFNATITGTVMDPSGAAVPNVELTLTSAATSAVAKSTSGPDGLFRFPNLQHGAYELKASAKGFRDFVQRGIAVNINETVRVDVKLELGTAVQTVEVLANVSPLNFENAEVKGVMTPQTIQDLPLIVGGNQRAAATFIILMPGVSTGSGDNPFNARINGGLQSGDEAVLDGITTQQGVMSQTGLISIWNDYPITPDSVSEVSVLTSNYEPQYGSTTSGVITLVTKSGTSEFHGSAFEFLRNTSLNARQFGVPSRPKDIEHDFGATLGGPLKIPWLAWSGRRKTYFFVAIGRYYIRGAAVAPVLSIPSLKERQGDFTDWVDANGNSIPIYDPATTRPNPAYDPTLPVGPTNEPFLRDQFMGCDGNTPNVICPTDPRLQNSLAKEWLQYLPNPTFPGALTNYVAPPYASVGGAPLDHKVNYDVRVDHYIGEKDHIAVNLHYHVPIYNRSSYLPPQLADERFITGGGSVGPWVNRLNWDHTFTPTLLNNFNYGYLNFWGENSCVNDPHVGELPQIPGVADHLATSALTFENFQSFDCNGNSKERRPTNVVNDLLTWVRGKHTLKFGGEYRALALNTRTHTNSSGTFNFVRRSTGLLGTNSGNAIASFLLEQVDSANVSFYTVDTPYARADTSVLYVGDTWKLTPKLSLNYGVRWDMARPSVEKFDQLAFFDPLGPNPDAGNRPGRLAYAGTKSRLTGQSWGGAAFGRRHPEETYKRAFAPRLGLAYAWTPKTVVRTGYGIFYTQAFYPGWGGGMSLDGFNATPSFSSTNGGLTAAFLLSEGFPQNFARPPFIDPGFLNGQEGPMYRPFDANRLSNAQQWNLTVEHQLTPNLYITAAYVGNKGTRLPSTAVPLNALDPKYLSMGQQLYDQFQPGQTELDGVPIPYAGWVEQMMGCAPTVAQALLPYPQYCGGLRGMNENAGNSTYHSFQFKAEKRFSHGVWFLASYTLSKLLTSSDHVDQPAGGGVWSGAHGVISPFERQRNKALAQDDVPQALSVAFIYQLPFGKGQRFLNKSGVVDKVLGGWGVNSIFRISSGTPLFFRSSSCNVPSQFRVGCIPAILPGADPWAQDKGNFDPTKPLFNVAAFEPIDSFNFYYGKGPRVSDLRGFNYYNHDLALVKMTGITERVKVQFRAEFFNAWNWHTFTWGGEWAGQALNTDIASPDFGMWNGDVSDPRNIQFGLRIQF